MTIIQCKICRKPFQSLGNKTCNECLDKIDRDFITVRDYIYDNPNSKMEKIIEDTQVEKSVILQLLKEGRLTLDTPGAGGLLLCEICKEPINSGRMCNVCKEKVSKTMTKSSGGSIPVSTDKNKSTTGKYNAKMHTDISDRKR